MAKHHFHLKAQWPGGRNSEGYIEAGNLQSVISIPDAMDGPGVGTNPDEMLLGAASTCYLITLAAMIERRNLPLEEMLLESVGIVEVHNGVFTYERIIHQPTVILKEEATDEQFVTLEKLVKAADKSCMISRAIRGNVEVEVQANLPRIKSNVNNSF
ncbi:OsmC family protein [Virgibacillus sp. W0430]|uniref:OsmC family protein n=1 Tax=Virgibacillus sp. W0430 TaxID=3391580 RepID=UPI003F48B2D3